MGSSAAEGQEGLCGNGLLWGLISCFHSLQTSLSVVWFRPKHHQVKQYWRQSFSWADLDNVVYPEVPHHCSQWRRWWDGIGPAPDGGCFSLLAHLLWQFQLHTYTHLVLRVQIMLLCKHVEIQGGALPVCKELLDQQIRCKHKPCICTYTCVCTQTDAKVVSYALSFI